MKKNTLGVPFGDAFASSVDENVQTMRCDPKTRRYRDPQKNSSATRAHLPKNNTTMKIALKIALYPGSFDPIHVGHLAIAQLMAQSHDLVFLIPSGVSPNKAHKVQTPGTIRANWIHTCIQSIQNPSLPNEKGGEGGKLRLSTFESNQNRRTYTLDTLLAFQKEYPQASLSLVCGADTAEKIRRWPSAAQIQRIASLTIIPRNNAPGNATQQTWDDSSSQVRNNITEGKPIGDLIPKPILQEVLNTFAPKNTEEHTQKIWNRCRHIRKNGNPQLARTLLGELQLLLQARVIAEEKQAVLTQLLEETLAQKMALGNPDPKPSPNSSPKPSPEPEIS